MSSGVVTEYHIDDDGRRFTIRDPVVAHLLSIEGARVTAVTMGDGDE